jgi:Protein of unknown function (DUF3040)
MNDEQVGTVIDEIERALVVDDPAFVRRFHSMRRNEAVNAAIVFVLLAVGAVFLTVAIATTTPVPGAIALAALIGAVLADEFHQHTRR